VRTGLDQTCETPTDALCGSARYHRPIRVLKTELLPVDCESRTDGRDGARCTLDE
jgi:hypothetical protein